MISAVVLSHNSSRTLKNSLESLSWCDETIVVDDNSEDESREIAKKDGALCILRSLHDDFAAQRNFGLEKAREEWILFVDSDEIVSEKLAKEIQTAIKSTVYDGYYMKRVDVLFGKKLLHGETGDAKFIRLAKKGTGVWERPVHEVWKVHGSVGQLRESLLHYPHPTIKEFLQSVIVYSRLHAKQLSRDGKTFAFWQILVYPVAKFCTNYFWKCGLLDGTAGLIVALMMSLHSFLARVQMWEWQQGVTKV